MAILDTRKISPYCAGHFVFRQKWKELDRVQVTYKATHFGAKIEYRFEKAHSLLGSICYDLQSGGDLKADHAAISYFMGDIPGAVESWQHICRIHALRPKLES